jgi:single-strand DNA-binding protein
MFAAEFDISLGSATKPSKPNTLTNMNKLSNTVRLIGNLGFEPEVRELAKGRKVARISVATNETYINGEGEKVTDTQWHTVVAWGSTAENVQRMLHKGSAVALEGRLVHRSYSSKDGIKRYVTEIVLNGFKLIGPKREPEQLRMAA